MKSKSLTITYKCGHEKSIYMSYNNAAHRDSKKAWLLNQASEELCFACANLKKAEELKADSTLPAIEGVSEKQINYGLVKRAEKMAEATPQNLMAELKVELRDKAEAIAELKVLWGKELTLSIIEDAWKLQVNEITSAKIWIEDSIASIVLAGLIRLGKKLATQGLNQEIIGTSPEATTKILKQMRNGAYLVKFIIAGLIFVRFVAQSVVQSWS